MDSVALVAEADYYVKLSNESDAGVAFTVAKST